MHFLLIIFGIIVILIAVVGWFWWSDYEEDEVIERWSGPVTVWTLRNNAILVFIAGLLVLLAGLFI